jgi:uncharacterized repeat protein (TIGR01451 family)
MKKMRFISIITCLVIGVSIMSSSVASFASDNVTSANVTATPTPTPTPTVTPEPTTEPAPAETVAFSTEFPTLDIVATGSFQFNLTLDYKGAAQRIFDLKASVPSGWDVYFQPQYEAGKRISSITIDSSYSGMSKQLTLTATTPTSPAPEAGDYKILVQATSGNLTGSLQLVAKVNAKYALYVVPVNQLYNTTAQAGKNNVYSIQLSNTGSSTLNNITFTSTHPDGWEIKFTPDKLDALKTTDTKTVDVNIKPPPKTVSGDYMITVQVSGKEATADTMNIRVTVNTPTIWGWIGVLIIVIVVVGLFLIIMRFGRR